MRVPRRFVLGPGSAFHLFWRGHNREWILKTPKEKSSYLDFLHSAMRAQPSAKVRLFSYCLMGNHPHLTGQIHPEASGVLPLSRLFQTANSLFGRWYNRFHRRSGKVAEDRFKTLRIQDDVHLQTVMFYSDANPVRAGIVKHPRDYAWSSYRYYAFGERSSASQFLTEPGWYAELGRTARLRQRAYRRLVDAYLRATGLIRDSALTVGWFIGSADFVEQAASEVRAKLGALRAARAGARGP